MTITSDQLQKLNALESIPLADWNLMIDAVRQLLDNPGSGGGGGTSGPQRTFNLIVGSETWTIAGHRDGAGYRYLLIRWSDVSDITTSNMDAMIPLDVINP